MALMGHWLHFGYSDLLDMDMSVFMKFVEECESLAKSGQ